MHPAIELQPLERRLLLASTPSQPRADTLGKAFDAGERQILLNRMTHLSAGVRSELQSKLTASVGQFDNALLNHMRSRSGPSFFFNPDDTDEIGSFIAANGISYTDLKTHADAVTDSHLFPEQASAGDYTVDLPESINWVAPGSSANPEFLHTMNRHEWWREMAWVSAITGNEKYADEIEYELASWSQQFPTAETPSAWSKSDREGWLLDTSLRGEMWTWTYFGFLEHPEFSGAENSLFLYKMLQTGDFLYENAISTGDFGSNKTIVLGKGLLYLGAMFPEFDHAGNWESSARALLFKCMDRQIYDDGSHVEQSPGYAFNVADDLLDARQLDRLNDTGWPKEQRIKLANIIDSYWQFLSPNGRRPAIGDTYRNDARGVFVKPNLVLETTRWPMAKPRPRDVFIAGIDAVSPLLSAPATPASLGARGKTYAMPDSGNYVMRSGDNADARQIVFDAGPKGGSHGHFDLLGFELSGFGRPLISDPGAYKYDKSDDRAYVVSTKAHNTVNVDARNHAALEGSGHPDIIVSQWRTGVDFAQITATHRGYKQLDGSPILTRSLWYDLDGTILIVDWAQGGARHKYQQSFNLQTQGDVNNVTVDAANLTARTRYPSGGNVKIQSIREDDGETAVKGPLTFVTNTVGGDYKDDAYRFTIHQSGKFVVFVTLITTYNGTSPPSITAKLLAAPSESGPIRVQLTKNGVARQIDFVRPALSGLDSTATTRGTFNDIAFDRSNRLHLAYADRDTGALMYALWDAKGKWSVPAIITPPANADAGGGYEYVSLALDHGGNPAVAFFDGWSGDLRYSFRDPTTQKWQTQTIDSKGSTGLYPSLAFSRENTPAISYYHRTDGDLKLAQSNGKSFSIVPIDTAGNVGRSSSLMLDPNRPRITRWAVGYEDTTHGDYKYALQGDWDGGTTAHGFTNYIVQDLIEAGGYTSLAFYDSGSADNKRYKPAMSYYDAGETALRFAKSSDIGKTWSTQVVASRGVQGLYTNLFFDSAGTPNIFFFDRTNNEARRATLSGNSWNLFDLRAGGRAMNVALNSTGQIAYSTLNEADGTLHIHLIA